MTRLLVLGDLNLDIHAEEPSPTSPGQETRSAVRVVPGGSAATFARAARRLGADVLFLGAVGRDMAGDLLERDLVAAGIEPHLERAALPSGAVLSLFRGGDRSMICARGANDALDADAVSASLFAHVDHVHISGYAFLSESQARAGRKALRLAHESGATVSINTPPVSLIESFGTHAYREAMRGADMVVLNRDEGRCLTGLDADEAIVEALAHTHSRGALTLGAEGALAWRGDERAVGRPPRRLDVDPTGAGDVFAATFVLRLLRRSRLDAAVADACARAYEHLAERAAVATSS